MILNNKTQSLQHFDPIKLSKIYVYTRNLEDVMHVKTSPLVTWTVNLMTRVVHYILYVILNDRYY